jgi:hypothetical protein
MRRTKMSRAQKEKSETNPDAFFQLITENVAEVNATGSGVMEVSLEQRKKAANRPLYLKRI